MAADVCITEYTDPGCPWAYSAEPFRRRLNWLYGERIEWQGGGGGRAGGPAHTHRARAAPPRALRATGFPPRAPARRLPQDRPRPRDADRHIRPSADGGHHAGLPRRRR